MSKRLHFLAASAILGVMMATPSLHAAPDPDNGSFSFKMTVSAGAKTCLPDATADVKISHSGSNETMDISVQGLPPNADFNVFVIQVPKAPFGVSWYQGDIETDKHGRGHAQFVGRFSIETFTVAPGTAPAPVVFNGPFPDASSNPGFNPIQMYHVGIWFDSPETAQAAGCPATVTPFNGDHNAGIQVMNTAGFADDQGPLRSVTPSTPKPNKH